MIVALIGISMPVFWLGEVLNLLTQHQFHNSFLFAWVPPLGYTPFTQDPVKWFEGLVIPWITLSVLYIGVYARVLRANLLEVQNEDYVRTARAKGLSERRVLMRHTLRTSMITFVSLFGLDFGALVGGGVLLVEVVFGIHGVGLPDVPVAHQPRPARRSWRPSSTARSSSCSRTRSSTSPTPGSIRGSGSPDGRAAARGHGSQGLVPHRGRPRAGGRRRQLLDRKGRGAGHRRRVGLRQERHADDRDAAHHRPERRVRGSGDLQGPRPDEARPGRHARGARVRDRDDLPGPDDLAQPGLQRRVADRRADPGPRGRVEGAGQRPGRRPPRGGGHPERRASGSATTRTSSRAACASA